MRREEEVKWRVEADPGGREGNPLPALARLLRGLAKLGTPAAAVAPNPGLFTRPMPAGYWRLVWDRGA